MAETGKTTNELAAERNEMAWGRTVMALERSMMAWIRTSLSLIGFGFTIFKFLQAMQNGAGSHIRENAPRNLGIFLIFLGMGLLILAIIQFKKAMGRIQQFSAMKPQSSISVIAAVGVLIAGLFTILNIFFGFGGF